MQNEQSLPGATEASNHFAGQLYVRPALRPRPLPGLPLRGCVLRRSRRRDGTVAVYACPVAEAEALVTAGEA